mmetsp:Transcript_39469/g.126524  ORF Transcript_39469/g.126524 Transcript_39469/m.126524 type:complete len:215 (-) Transcript_39469:524-1168(-)
MCSVHPAQVLCQHLAQLLQLGKLPLRIPCMISVHISDDSVLLSDVGAPLQEVESLLQEQQLLLCHRQGGGVLLGLGGNHIGLHQEVGHELADASWQSDQRGEAWDCTSARRICWRRSWSHTRVLKVPEAPLQPCTYEVRVRGVSSLAGMRGRTGSLECHVELSLHRGDVELCLIALRKFAREELAQGSSESRSIVRSIVRWARRQRTRTRRQQG